MRGRKVESKKENTVADCETTTATIAHKLGRVQLGAGGGNGTQILGSRMVDWFMTARKLTGSYGCSQTYAYDWLEMSGSWILLLVVAPSFFANTLKGIWVGVVICLIIGCYLLQEHIRAFGGFRSSFTQSHGISNTLGIILLLVYPVWALVIHFI